MAFRMSAVRGEAEVLAHCSELPVLAKSRSSLQSTVHPANQCVLKGSREFAPRREPAFQALQLRAHSFEAAHEPGHGGWCVR